MRIEPAASDEDFRAVERLMLSMRQLDERMSAAHGLPPEAVAGFYEGRTADVLAARFRRPDAAMVVARAPDCIAGCGGFTEEGGAVGELHHVFVDDRFRGQGVGANILSTLMAEARRRGLREIRLETAGFLTAAIAMYRRAGFADCPPFRPVAPELEALSVFMRCKL